MIAQGSQNSEDDPVYHVSPDGLLALTVQSDVDGEQLIGFHGFDWSVQMSVLGELANEPAAAAGAKFIDSILRDQALIAVLEQNGMMVDVWITEDPKVDLNYLQEGESLSFRYWSGKTALPTE